MFLSSCSYVQPFLVFDVLLWVRRRLSEFDCASVVGAASTIGLAALLRISTGWVGMCVNWSVYICVYIRFHSAFFFLSTVMIPARK